MAALQKWNGGVIIISHDERFITTVAKEVWKFDPWRLSCSTKSFGKLWVCGDGTVTKFKGDVQSYKVRNHLFSYRYHTLIWPWNNRNSLWVISKRSLKIHRGIPTERTPIPDVEVPDWTSSQENTTITPMIGAIVLPLYFFCSVPL